MGTTRRYLGVATLGNKIYAVGGTDGHYSLYTAEVYDPDQNTWEAIASMGVARSALGVLSRE